MGKNSLIKSTSKKKKPTKKTEGPKSDNTNNTNKPTPETETPSTSRMDASRDRDKNISPPVKKADPEPGITEKPEVKKTPRPQTTAVPEAEPQAPVTYDVSPESATGDPMDKTLLVIIGCIFFLSILVIGASVVNTSRYYIKNMPMGIEIWQGKFAPLGRKMVIALPEITVPESEKTVFNRNEVYPLIFSHYLNKADAVLARPGIPDYETIKTHLTRARKYAVTSELADAVTRRLVAIDFNNLLYRASIASSHQNLEDLEKALDYLAEASRLKLNSSQLDQVTQQRELIEEMLSTLRESEAANE